MEMEKRPLVVITGPTAAGKTALSLALASRIGGEIISADSIAVYRHMDIGSAKIRPEETRGIPHHLIDVLEPEEDFHVVLFQQLAKEAMKGIYARGHIPVVVGGTGFYIQALTRDIDFTRAENMESLREDLEAFAREHGAHALHERLRQVDPQSAAAIHENNVKRVIRALEFYEQNRSPISIHNQAQRQQKSPYNLACFVLTAPRPVLYERIDRRVDRMIGEGLIEEVRMLKARGCHKGMVSMQGLGYKEILSYLDGEIGLEEAVRILKRDTRHFAKRQLTWFRREEDVIWVDKSMFDYDEERILEWMLHTLAADHGIPAGSALATADKHFSRQSFCDII